MHSSALMVAAALLAPAHAARVDAGHGISVRVPAGWHLVRRSLTDVTEPALRLAVTSPGVRVTPSRCECDWPDVRPSGRGAFMLMWEAPAPSKRSRWRIPRRPAAFHVGQFSRHLFTCAGPSWGALMLDAGREFQVEVYLGPRAGRRVRARMDRLLDSLRVASGDYFHPEPLAVGGGARVFHRED